MSSKRNLTNTEPEKLMPHLDMYQSLTVTEIKGCKHISSVTSDELWISDKDNNLLLINTIGGALHCVDDFQKKCYSCQGPHAVNNHREFCNVDTFDDNIKLSSDLETISSVTSDDTRISDNKNGILLNYTVGDALHYVEDFHEISYLRQGLHTVNCLGDLFYVNMLNAINKLSYDMKTITTFIEKKYDSWFPWCLYWSPFSDNLLVVKWGLPWASKVDRYNRTGQLIHTTQFDSSGLEIYYRPNYITENNNMDIVVSDKGAVVVTSRDGKYRFSYTGHPQEEGLAPLGICTNELSQILVCDDKTKTVQIIDKDGQFLSNLLSKQNLTIQPCCLWYDVNTHTLWIGSYITNIISVYKYKEEDINSGMFIIYKVIVITRTSSKYT